MKEDYIALLKAYKGKRLAITGQSDYRVLEDISLIDGVTISC